MWVYDPREDFLLPTTVHWPEWLTHGLGRRHDNRSQHYVVLYASGRCAVWHTLKVRKLSRGSTPCPAPPYPTPHTHPPTGRAPPPPSLCAPCPRLPSYVTQSRPAPISRQDIHNVFESILSFAPNGFLFRAESHCRPDPRPRLRPPSRHRNEITVTCPGCLPAAACPTTSTSLLRRYTDNTAKTIVVVLLK